MIRRLALLLAPDLHRVYRQVRQAEKNLRTTESFLSLAKTRTSSSDGGRAAIESAEGYLASARTDLAEVLEALLHGAF